MQDYMGKGTKDMGDIVEKLYCLLVNQNPDITLKYQKYRSRVTGSSRVKAWVYLLKLNMQYYFFHRDSVEANNDFFEKKKLFLNGSESSLSQLERPEDFVRKLQKYDVITFDVFDTLIFRPFSKPTDLFFLVGAKLNYQDFERIRIEVEQIRRNKAYQENGNYEITFDEIWEQMEEETGISKDTGQCAEWECEYQYCFANPYMLEVVKLLHNSGKKVAVVSDMYLGKEQQMKLLEHCGYEKFDEYFISCDFHKSKSEGSLFDIVKNTYGKELKYAHIGDNEYSDVKQAEKHGFCSYLYHNVNYQGMKFRAEDMSAINGSIYRGLINSYIHNGLHTYALEYEYGFIYGGLFVLGYCKWIHDYVISHEIDKILFLARDGDILSKVYNFLYPKEHIPSEYVYWSRLVATKMSSNYFKYDFFRRFLFHKINQNYSIEKIFQSMDLEALLPDFLQSKENSHGLTLISILDEKAAKSIKKYLLSRWGKVQESYASQKNKAKSYYSKALKDCKKVVAVDVGWAGSGAITLDYLVNQEWNLECTIIGLLAGTNTIFNQEVNSSEPMLYNGKLVSYMFSQEHNRDIWKLHNPNKGHNIVVELLLASGNKSLRSFGGEGEDMVFCESEEEINSAEVQKGIMDFVSYYVKHIKNVPDISGRDAFAPIEVVLKNEKWWKQLISIKDVTMNLE